jgi:hypothetical protein
MAFFLKKFTVKSPLKVSLGVVDLNAKMREILNGRNVTLRLLNWCNCK